MSTLIGITGQIGSGKTTAASVLAKMGAGIINADKIGREVVEKNRILIKRLSKAFGKEIVNPGGHLNRQQVAHIAFSSNSNKKKLDRIVHPFLLKALRRQIQIKQKKNEVVVIDAALLLDWQLEKVVDKVLLIHSAENTRLNRISKRGIKRTDAKRRQRWQMSYAEMRKRSDKIILNNSTQKAFESKVRNWAKQFFHSN